jgi:hypothetical protein
MKIEKQKLKICLGIIADTCAELKFSDEIADSLILAGIAFFTTLTTNYVTGGDIKDSLIRCLINAGLIFFTTLGVRRGLMSKGKPKDESTAT